MRLAKDLHQSNHKITIQLFEMIIESCLRLGNLLLANRWISLIGEVSNMKPTTKILNLLIDKWIGINEKLDLQQFQHRNKEALRAWNSMAAKNVNPNQNTFLLFILFNLHNWQFDQAWQWLQKFLQHSQKVVNDQISSQDQQQQQIQLQQIQQQQQQLQLQLQQQQKEEWIEQIFHPIFKTLCQLSSPHPTTTTTTNNFEQQTNNFEQTTTTNNFEQRPKEDKVEQISTTQRDKEEDDERHSILIHLNNLLDIMISQNIKIDISIFNRILEIYFNLDLNQEALQLFQDLVMAQKSQQQSQQFDRSQQSQKSQQQFEGSQKCGFSNSLQPNSSTFTLLITKFANLDDVKTIQLILKCVEEFRDIEIDSKQIFLPILSIYTKHFSVPF